MPTVAAILDAERQRQGQSINGLARAAGMQPSQCLRRLGVRLFCKFGTDSLAFCCKDGILKV